MTSLRYVWPLSILLTLSIPALAVDRKPAASPGATTTSKQSSAAAKPTSASLDRKEAHAVKRPGAGAADRKSAALRGAATTSKQSSAAIKQTSAKPNTKEAHAVKRPVAGAADRKPAASPGATTSSKQSSAAIKQTSAKPNTTEPHAIKRHVAGAADRKPVASPRAAATSKQSSAAIKQTSAKPNTKEAHAIRRPVAGAADRKPAASPGAAATSKQSSAAVRHTSANLNSKEPHVIKRPIAGHPGPAAQNTLAPAEPPPAATGFYWGPPEIASAERFAPNAPTAAPSPPAPAPRVRVIRLAKREPVTVRINDGSPHAADRVAEVPQPRAQPPADAGQDMVRRPSLKPNRSVTYASKRHITGHRSPFVRTREAVAQSDRPGRGTAAVSEPDARKRHIAKHQSPKMRNKQASPPADTSAGVASFYSREQKTANGEDFAPHELTAAHRTLPFGTRVRVINLTSGESVTVRINDRGPYVAGRVIDVSQSAAASLGMVDQGLAKVKLEVVE